MIVTDASAVLDLLLLRPSAPQIEEYLGDAEVVCAPHILDLEVAHVLRRYSLTEGLSFERGREALRDFLDLGIVRYPHGSLLGRIWELRHNVTAYDAAYLALAEFLSAPLLTCDQRLASASGHSATVEVLGVDV